MISLVTVRQQILGVCDTLDLMMVVVSNNGEPPFVRKGSKSLLKGSIILVASTCSTSWWDVGWLTNAAPVLLHVFGVHE
jgi:hypothetical protein